MTDKISLLAEKGGYQLYRHDGEELYRCEEVPNIIKELGEENDKLKFVVNSTYSNRIMKEHAEDPLSAFINYSIERLDNSAFRHNYADGSQGLEKFAGSTLEETIENLKTAANPFERSSAHWHDYGKVIGIYFGVGSYDVSDNPLIGLPPQLLLTRLKQQTDHFDHEGKIYRTLYDGASSLGCSPEAILEIKGKVRSGDSGTIQEVIQGVKRKFPKSDENDTVKSLKKWAVNGFELEYLQTNLDILNYLKSRIDE